MVHRIFIVHVPTKRKIKIKIKIKINKWESFDLD
jgi:hypothetical protein